MKKLAVVAFGGNALLRAGEEGSFEQQLNNVMEACRQLVPLLKDGWGLVIGHGNGPQVGNVMLQQEAGRKEYGLPSMPMDFCGAQTQGSIAYLIETGLERVLREEGLDRPVLSVVTRVEVDASDPAFRNPTKPVGPYYKEKPADGAAYREDPRGLGWRKVVPSPKPLSICNIGLVEKLAREGVIVITVGGGGIPVVREGGVFKGVEAVIDKDLASSLAAVRMKADAFHILTDVPKICLNFKKPDQRELDRLTLQQARGYLSDGQFTEGSMAPKVRAAIAYLEAGGKECFISQTRITNQ